MKIDVRTVEKAVKKLEGTDAPGEVEYTESRGGHNRYSYYFNGELLFTFGITRGSNKREKSLYYVPDHMGLNNAEFRNFCSCSFSKEDLNNKWRP